MPADIFPNDLKAALRFSLRPTSDILRAVQDIDDPINVNDPRVKKLIEAILFSRRFILTYYAVILVAVLTWAGIRWTTRYRRRSKVRKIEEERDKKESSIPSSSSSTLFGTGNTSPNKVPVDETQPLLQRVSRDLEDSTWTCLQRHAKAALVTQPRPISALTSHENTLPINETSILILLYLALNLFYLFYKTPLSWPMIFAFGDRAALLFIVNLPLLYVLAAKNNQPLRWLTGWSYEGLNLMHRRLGEWMTVAAILHGISMMIVWYMLFRPFGFDLVWYLTRRVILIGILALFTYLAIFASSIGYVRQACYEVFLGLHVFLQVAALVLLFFHHHNARPYVGAALAIWTMDRIVFRIFTSSKTFIADLEIAKDGKTVLVHVRIPVGTSKTGICSGWRSGQHVFVTIPGIGWKHRLQAHPFTIASPAPPRSRTNQTWPLLLIIRAQTGFSKELLDYAQYHQHTLVRLDGAYGSTDVLDAAKTSDRVCFIAGGSGVAVTYPLSWEYCFGTTSDDQTPISLRTQYLNGYKYVPQVHVANLPINSQTYRHLWIRQSTDHDSWIKYLPRQEPSEANATGSYDFTKMALNAANLISYRIATRDAAALWSTRPDIDLELRDWVEHSSTVKMNKNERICVVVSGPDTLVRNVRNSAASLIREGWNIEVWVEKFGW